MCKVSTLAVGPGFGFPRSTELAHLNMVWFAESHIYNVLLHHLAFCFLKIPFVTQELSRLLVLIDVGNCF